MKRLVLAVFFASLTTILLPSVSAAQCEGGPVIAAFYLRNGGLHPGGCVYTNPTTTGQLYPSGAQPVPSTNPALADTRLPGQTVPSGLTPSVVIDVGGIASGLTPGQVAAAGTQFVTTAGPGAGVVPNPFAGVSVLPSTGLEAGGPNVLNEQLNRAPLGGAPTSVGVAPISTTFGATGQSLDVTVNSLSATGPVGVTGGLAPTQPTSAVGIASGPLAVGTGGLPVAVSVGSALPAGTGGAVPANAAATVGAGARLGVQVPVVPDPGVLTSQLLPVPSAVTGADVAAGPGFSEVAGRTVGGVVNGPPAPAGPQPPPAPGRGGSTFIGEAVR